MKLNNKNFLFILAAVLVVAMGIMAVVLNYQNKKNMGSDIKHEIMEINTQSQSDDVSEIEEDLMDTDLTNIDRELQDIENELNSIE